MADYTITPVSSSCLMRGNEGTDMGAICKCKEYYCLTDFVTYDIAINSYYY